MPGSIFRERKRSGTTMQKKPLFGGMSHNQHKVAVAEPLAGFPKDEKFQSVEDIEHYLSGDKIVCLVCGRSFFALNAHLQMHDMDAADYKHRFGMPSKYPVAPICMQAVWREKCGQHKTNVLFKKDAPLGARSRRINTPKHALAPLAEQAFLRQQDVFRTKRREKDERWLNAIAATMEF